MVNTVEEHNGNSANLPSSSVKTENGHTRNGVSTDLATAQSNGNAVENGATAATKRNAGTTGSALQPKATQPEVIEIDDDDDVSIAEPSAKRRKESPVPEDPKVSKPSTPATATTAAVAQRKASTGKKEPELTSYAALLDKLEGYTSNAINSHENVDRKMLDALLAAINVQVQKEPYSVRRLILEKQLVLPNTISFPPSQVVELLIEHDPDHQLSRVITKLFGDERPKLSDNERRERQQLKISHPAPNMTKLLMDIGLDLVQESTYCDIVHARNLPEIPKNMDTYKQVAAQLKPVWEGLKAKNEPLKLKSLTCQVCGYKTDSRTVMAIHRQTLHFSGRKYQCALCPEFDTNVSRINKHYMEEHGLKPIEPEEPPSKVQCPICEEDFAYKGHRDGHLKMCKRDVNRIKTLQATRAPEHIGMVNRWLWDKPPLEPSILAQQQDLQKQQQLKQQQQRLAAAAAAAAAASAQAPAAKPTSSAYAQRHAGTSNGSGTRGLTAQQLLAQQRENQMKLQLLQTNRQQLAQLFKTPNQISPEIMQAIQQLQRQQQLIQSQIAANKAAAAAATHTPATKTSTPRGRASLPASMQTPPSAGRTLASVSGASAAASTASATIICEICDIPIAERSTYLLHLQANHKQLRGKTPSDMQQGAPLACSRCRDRFWTYEGLERHLVMGHGLVTSDLLAKAQRKDDGGRCKLCGKQYAFNMLQHLVMDHQVKLCSAEIMYSCDVCSFKCSSYQKLETHLSEVHPKSQTGTPGTTVR